MFFEKSWGYLFLSGELISKYLKIEMTKLLFVVIISSLVACGEGTSTTTTTDTIAVTVDSTPVVVADTAKVVDSVAAVVNTTKY